MADRDFADFTGESYGTACLLLTDFACMDMYLFTEQVFEVLFQSQFPDYPVAVSEFLRIVSSVAQELFLIRLVSYKSELWLDFKDYSPVKLLELRDDRITFDCSEYLDRLLMKHNLAWFRPQFSVGVNEARTGFRQDCRHQMNGHDIARICTWYIRRNFRPVQPFDVDDFFDELLACVDYDSVASERLFRMLLDRVCIA